MFLEVLNLNLFEVHIDFGKDRVFRSTPQETTADLADENGTGESALPPVEHVAV